MRTLDIQNWLTWRTQAEMPHRSIYDGAWIDLANPGNSYDPDHQY